MVFVQEANSQVRLQQTLFLIVNSDLILRREDQEMELLLTLDIVLMIDQIRLTLGLVMSPGCPEVQGCPTTEQNQESLTLESRK